MSVGADPPTWPAPSGPLNDARHRAEGTTRADGLKVHAAIRRRERSRCGSVRHLLVCTQRLRVERAFSARFPSIDDRRRNRSSPIEFINSPGRPKPSGRIRIALPRRSAQEERRGESGDSGLHTPRYESMAAFASTKEQPVRRRKEATAPITLPESMSRISSSLRPGRQAGGFSADGAGECESGAEAGSS